MPFSYNDAHENILNWEGLTENQRKTFVGFDEWLQLQRDIKISTRYLYLQRLKMFVVWVGKKPFEALTTDDVKKYLLSRSEGTRTIDSVTFKVFSTFLGRTDIYESFKTLKQKRKKEPDYLEEWEVKAMLNACLDPYERALVSFLYDSGARLGELRNLKINDVLFDEHGARVRLNGKTGPRTIRLVTSVPTIQELINHHPLKDDLEAPLFYGKRKVDYGTAMGALGLRLKVKRIARRAQIKKNVKPHMLRHSACTELAKFMTDREMIQRFGWNENSRMVAVYSHVQMRDIDNHYLEIKGRTMEKEKAREPEIKIVECARCGTENDSVSQFCKTCGLVLDRVKAEKLVKVQREKDLRFEQLEKSVSEMQDYLARKWRNRAKK